MTDQVWAKPLPQHEVAVLVLNTGLENVTVQLSVQTDVPGRPTGETYRDIWNKKDVPIAAGGKVLLELTPHDNVFAVFSKTEDRW